MTTAATAPLLTERSANAPFSTRTLLILWLISGVILLAGLGGPPVTRTQEARVLETAREMLGTGVRGWLVPRLEDRLRLQKPPLCYWMVAGMYELSGRVDETVGRIPTAVIGGLTLLATFIFARRLFDQWTALASSAALLGSYMFFKNTRVAETDAPTMLFVTVAIYALYRADSSFILHPSSFPAEPSPQPSPGVPGEGVSGWLHLAAAMMGLAIFAKGGPGAYPALFMIGFCAIERRWNLVKQFFTSGAIVTLLLIALPWFIYITATLGTFTFRDEVDTVVHGRDHFDWPYVYIPSLLIAVAPWTGVLPLALFDAIRSWRKNASVRIILLWCAAVFTPLCFIGNKQQHYLTPLLPPIMMLIGRTLVLATRKEDYLYGWMRWVLIGTIVVSIAGVAGAIMFPIQQQGHVRSIDIIVASLIGLATMSCAVVTFTKGIRLGFASLAIWTALLMPLIFGGWIDNLPRSTTRITADTVKQHFGDGPFVFFGPNNSAALCFNLRIAIPWAENLQQLPPLVYPGTIVIAQNKNGAPPPPLPSQYVHEFQFQADDQTFDFYRLIQQ